MAKGVSLVKKPKALPVKVPRRKGKDLFTHRRSHVQEHEGMMRWMKKPAFRPDGVVSILET